jgi:hypothetical protein
MFIQILKMFPYNIIIHETTRLLYFSDDRIEYDYLPPDALDYYDTINIKDFFGGGPVFFARGVYRHHL